MGALKQPDTHQRVHLPGAICRLRGAPLFWAVSKGKQRTATFAPGPLRIPMYVKIVGREVPFPLVVRPPDRGNPRGPVFVVRFGCPGKVEINNQ